MRRCFIAILYIHRPCGSLYNSSQNIEYDVWKLERYNDRHIGAHIFESIFIYLLFVFIYRSHVLTHRSCRQVWYLGPFTGI